MDMLIYYHDYGHIKEPKYTFKQIKSMPFLLLYIVASGLKGQYLPLIRVTDTTRYNQVRGDEVYLS